MGDLRVSRQGRPTLGSVRYALICLPAVCVMLAAIASPAFGQSASDWEGTWSTDYGEMVIEADGSGTYTFCDGKLSGSIAGSVYSGTWTQRFPCGGAQEGSGDFKFTLTSPTTFEGYATYTTAAPGYKPPWNGSKIAGPPDNTPGEENEKCKDNAVATIVKITGDVHVLAKGPDEKFQDGRVGRTLCVDDSLFTGPDSNVVIRMANGHEVTLDDLTAISVRAFATNESRILTVLSLTEGRLKAKEVRQTVIRSDFSVQTPVATAGVRGTTFSIAHDALRKQTTEVTEEGEVEVDPTGAGETTIVGAGQAVDVTKSGVESVAPTEVEARNEAMDRALNVIKRNGKRCKLEAKAASSVAAGKGFKVTIKTSKGTSTWSVKGSKVTAANKLAEKIDHGCK